MQRFVLIGIGETLASDQILRTVTSHDSLARRITQLTHDIWVNIRIMNN